ncbi:MAG TPA: hypothetical protein VLG49_04500 [Rhabdochlamydiaceae bacterium]|nr:hypothetical protein [Rhabdochlamydiaceae bacterium]
MAIDFLVNSTQNVCKGYLEILLNGFDESQNYPVKFSHFIPYSKWERNRFYIIDRTNNDRYSDDSVRVKGLKCSALAAATPVVHAISTVLNVANRIGKLITFSHFWHPSQSYGYSFERRLFQFGKDLLRVAFSPMIYIGLELSAIYGMVLPYDGGKLYATFERCAFGKGLLAPCFQPEPTYHLGGGDINQPNSW